MRTPRTKKLIRDIAVNESLDIKQVDEIVNSFFRFTKTQIEKGDKRTISFPEIRLYKFGVFKLKVGKRLAYEKFIRDQQRSANDESRSSDDKGV